MKTKLEMAHEWYMMQVRRNGCALVTDAWQYADAMQAEADKRLAEAEYKEEWQPDWSQAPDGFNWWAMDKSGECYWFSGERHPKISIHIFKPSIRGYADEAPCFNYKGNWRDSLRKRPN